MFGLMLGWVSEKANFQVEDIQALERREDGKYHSPHYPNFHLPGVGWYKYPLKGFTQSEDFCCPQAWLDVTETGLAVVFKTFEEALAFRCGFSVGTNSTIHRSFQRVQESLSLNN